jgi:lysyl-tRNA synthetase class 2
MPTVTLHIAPTIFERFPDISVSCIMVAGLREACERVDLPALREAARARIEAEGLDRETLSAHPVIKAWRAAYSKQRLKPTKYRSSIEALLRRAVRDDPIETPVPAVNIYNAISIAHMAPLGAYDTARLPGTRIDLRPANAEHDSFQPIGSLSGMRLDPEICVFAAGDEVLGWALNHRDSKLAGLVPETDVGIFLGEAVDPVHAAGLADASTELGDVFEAGPSTAKRRRPLYRLRGAATQASTRWPQTEPSLVSRAMSSPRSSSRPESREPFYAARVP